MKLTILCKDFDVDLVRERAKSLFRFRVLKIPVSKTGEFPQTHWICELNVSEAGLKKVISMRIDSIMEPISKMEMLIKYGLKEIK